MGRGKRAAAVRRESQAALSTHGRSRLAPKISPLPPDYTPEEERALLGQLEEAGVSESSLSEPERRKLIALYLDASGDQEERVESAVEEFTEELMEAEEETEQCDRCDKVVRAGHGLYWPPEEYADLIEGSDEERLCQGCYDKAEAAFTMETAMGDGQDVLEGRGTPAPRRG